MGTKFQIVYWKGKNKEKKYLKKHHKQHNCVQVWQRSTEINALIYFNWQLLYSCFPITAYLKYCKTRHKYRLTWVLIPWRKWSCCLQSAVGCNDHAGGNGLLHKLFWCHFDVVGQSPERKKTRDNNMKRGRNKEWAIEVYTSKNTFFILRKSKSKCVFHNKIKNHKFVIAESPKLTEKITALFNWKKGFIQ